MTQVTPSQWLDRSDDGQDHTVSPYASFRLRQKGFAGHALSGKHSIRINDQWRIVFRWTDTVPEDVEIMDYH
ncbi:hypothetical protein QWJ07_27690 [Frankia sp. RB7]|nr:hypothetical protein [Frankia sp. RB7]